MIKRKRASSSSLFLMELILAILIFCMAAAICISVFARSHIIHKDAVKIGKAIAAVESASQLILSAKSNEELIKRLDEFYPMAYIKSELNNNVIIPLDAELNPFLPGLAMDKESYNLILFPRSENGMFFVDLTVFDLSDNSVVYELEVKKALLDE